ncbi:MAG: YHS domain-containing protein [Proteobacteria bacterium]|nr:YHS domain-containing protein [Pseudomonadota bacterium]
MIGAMDPKDYNPETRRHPIQAGRETVPPTSATAVGGSRSKAAPPRPWLVPVAALVMLALVGGAMFVVYKMGLARGTRLAGGDASPSPSAAATKVLLLDPVCRKAVDPATAPAVLDFGGKSIYFDSLDCLNAFRSDPVKYGAGRIRVHIAPNAEASTAPAPTTEAAPPSLDSPMTDRPVDRGQSLDAPSDGPPAESPAAVPEPTQQSVNDAPPVTETYPTQPANELPPSAPRPSKAGGRSGSSTSAPRQGGAPPPKGADGPPPAAEPDENGFSLPPDLKEGPPSRKSEKSE